MPSLEHVCIIHDSYMPSMSDRRRIVCTHDVYSACVVLNTRYKDLGACADRARLRLRTRLALIPACKQTRYCMPSFLLVLRIDHANPSRPMRVVVDETFSQSLLTAFSSEWCSDYLRKIMLIQASVRPPRACNSKSIHGLLTDALLSRQEVAPELALPCNWSVENASSPRQCATKIY
jgi:hypothetical protein